jgi:hypothetical protein
VVWIARSARAITSIPFLCRCAIKDADKSISPLSGGGQRSLGGKEKKNNNNNNEFSSYSMSAFQDRTQAVRGRPGNNLRTALLPDDLQKRLRGIMSDRNFEQLITHHFYS